MTRAARTDPRGVAAVEVALILPLLMVLVLGTVELGFAFSASSKVETAVSSGARVAAQAGTDPLADWEILQVTRGALGAEVAQVDRVVVYHATSIDGSVPAACLTAAASLLGGVAGVCSIYSSADLVSLTQAAFEAGSAHVDGVGNPCGGANLAGWCPVDRVDTSSLPTMIGVHIDLTRPTITGYLPDLGTEVGSYAVARLEPAT